MTGPRIGSLFSGSGMLDEGVRSVLGGTVAWHVENDPAASKVLDRRYPGVPNHGDVSKVDWADVEPVDIITGGSPCQDVSAAGKRRGMRAGTRSGLWASMCDAIDIIRPRLVVWENVRGVLSAKADSSVEPCEFCVGDGSGPHLRALGRVVGDLSELGYDAEWVGLPAYDVGAPHERFRVFVLAWPAADTSGVGHEWGWGTRSGRPGPADRRRSAAPDALRPGARRDARAVPGATEEARRPGVDVHAAVNARDGAVPDAHRCRLGTVELDLFTGEPDTDGRATGDAAGGRDQDEPFGRAPQGLEVGPFARPVHRDRAGEPAEGVHIMGGTAPELAWGPYEPAIRRWERILGRPAPAPTAPGTKGQPKLSPEFDEWMMGWPEGWASDVPGVSWNDVLAMCGNGVVPQQAAAAVRFMLARLAEERRWAA